MPGGGGGQTNPGAASRRPLQETGRTCLNRPCQASARSSASLALHLRVSMGMTLLDECFRAGTAKCRCANQCGPGAFQESRRGKGWRSPAGPVWTVETILAKAFPPSVQVRITAYLNCRRCCLVHAAQNVVPSPLPLQQTAHRFHPGPSCRTCGAPVSHMAMCFSRQTLRSDSLSYAPRSSAWSQADEPPQPHKWSRNGQDG